MKCPHCFVEINPQFVERYLGEDSDGHWSIIYMSCPNSDCKKIIVRLISGTPNNNKGKAVGIYSVVSETTVKPIASSRPPAQLEVDDNFANDYNEACLILPFSPKASAALSRRCLQNTLREKANVKHSNLANEIQEVIDSGTIPSHIADSIDAVRNIGNFAAHPSKSTTTGEIAEVEVGEAEWLLDVLESLFDFYFVLPQKLKEKREALDKKLEELGKPPMKTNS